MADKIHFELVSPSRLLVSEDVDMVTVPGSEGDFGVLAGHAPVVSLIRTGVLSITDDARGDMRVFLRGGFAEVTKTGLTVLAEEATALADVDRNALESDLRNAEEDVRDASTDERQEAADKRLAGLVALRDALDE